MNEREAKRHLRPARLRWLSITLIVLLVTLASCGAPHTFNGTELTPREPAPDIALTDQHDRPFSLSAQRGRVVLLYFGYTHCPDVCPATLGTFKAVRQQLGDAAGDVRLVFVSVDPERDTPAVLRDYLDRIDPAIVGLTGSHAAIGQIIRAYGVYAAADAAGAASGHSVAHTERIFVIDRAGDWRLLYPFDVNPAILVDDLRALLA